MVPKRREARAQEHFGVLEHEGQVLEHRLLVESTRTAKVAQEAAAHDNHIGRRVLQIFFR